MVKFIYLGLVIVVLLPALFAAVICVQDARDTKEFQRDEQSRTTDSVYVLRKEITVGLGRSGVTFYPHNWAAILVLMGFLSCVLGLVVLFFVRPW
jgi:hypothetical protein